VTEAKTESRTISHLPLGWRYSKLQDIIAEAQPGFACGARSPNGVVQLRMNNVDTNGNFVWDEFIRVPTEVTDLDKYRLESGDILFNNTNSTELVGKSALFQGYSESVVYSNHFTRIKVNTERASPAFVTAWLIWQHKLGTFANLCNRWVGQSAVKNDILFNLGIPLPPTLTEQEHIAGILNEQMAAIEKARAAVEARLEAAEALPTAYLRQVFPKPGQELPDYWQWVKLKDVCDVVNGFGFPEHLQGRTDLPYPFIKVSDMNAPGAERVVTSAANTVNQEILNIIGGRVYSSGTVIFPKVGGALLTNKKRILGTAACFDNNVMGVVPKKVARDYVFYWFQTIDLRTLSNVQALPSVKQSSVAALELPLAPLSEQKRIEVILNERLTAVEELAQSVQQELEAINALLTALFRQTFTGGL
jgi:hypothetical protein